MSRAVLIVLSGLCKCRFVLSLFDQKTWGIWQLNLTARVSALFIWSEEAHCSAAVCLQPLHHFNFTTRDFSWVLNLTHEFVKVFFKYFKRPWIPSRGVKCPFSCSASWGWYQSRLRLWERFIPWKRFWHSNTKQSFHSPWVLCHLPVLFSNYL